MILIIFISFLSLSSTLEGSLLRQALTSDVENTLRKDDFQQINSFENVREDISKFFWKYVKQSEESSPVSKEFNESKKSNESKESNESKKSNESKESNESKSAEDQDWSWLEDKVVPKQSIKSKSSVDKVENQMEDLKPKVFDIDTNELRKVSDHNNAISEDSIDSKADIDVSVEKKLDTASKVALKTDTDENLEIIRGENLNKAPKNYLNDDSQQAINNFESEPVSDSKVDEIKSFKEDTSEDKALNENLNEVEKMEVNESGNIVSDEALKWFFDECRSYCSSTFLDNAACNQGCNLFYLSFSDNQVQYPARSKQDSIDEANHYCNQGCSGIEQDLECSQGCSIMINYLSIQPNTDDKNDEIDLTETEPEIQENSIPEFYISADESSEVEIGNLFDFLMWMRYLQMINYQNKGGLMNDRDEMNIPDKLFETQYSASQLVQDTHDTLVLAKDKVKTAFRNFDFQTFILIVMLGFSLSSLLTGLLECLFCKKTPKPIQYTDDYYTLKKEPYNPVLPTYEEVVFLDKNDLANIHLNDEVEVSKKV
ncbi:uncharacterized protein LOC111702350 isoform X2 [Eurytemora carolleeae]|uniref:uncharacterized protein LOC111702350 isoform X2 n=1 Tax=Eurytemora carolleeae TaxID=1294199 RepID=UPI000C778BAA|nr:uncharacterized protein LOC111702350 isoform X2 [Eurytemora carolleeae]|eukprot:XP_023329775.1 uncharacterized protein LOC111702350 isoform X2 [Eurytemora affinis]